jgi:hypothetical protein
LASFLDWDYYRDTRFGFSSANIGEFGQRGTTSGGLIKENFLAFL